MAKQIAVRIPDEQLDAVDREVEEGTFESRADAVRRALTGLLSELREQRIAREYREAYTQHPDDPAIGSAGAELLAEAFRREEDRSG